MFNRFILVVVFVPLAIILIALAVANRGPVAFTLDPFHPGNPALTLNLPLFIFLFLALAIGMVVGSLATWVKQGQTVLVGINGLAGLFRGRCVLRGHRVIEKKD